MADYLAHYGTEARNRPGAQVVSVAEPAGKNHDIHILEVVVLVPDIDCFFAERLYDGLVSVVVAI